MKKTFKYFWVSLFLTTGMIACDAPTTGDEIYDGDPETTDNVDEVLGKDEKETKDDPVGTDLRKEIRDTLD